MSQVLITREGLGRQSAPGQTEVSFEAHENSQKC